MVTTSMAMAFTQQATSRVVPIEEPQIAEFLPLTLMGSTIMKELKEYTNFHSQMPSVANLLVLSSSNAIGLIQE
jgi:hypothetical protein